MNTWVRRSLNAGALTAGALLVGGAAAQASPMTSTDNIGVLTGNQLQLPVQVPVDVCGNAVAVAGVAGAECDGGASALNSEWRFASYRGGSDQVSSGNIGALTGNQVQVPVQVPVDVCGNAVAVIGAAAAGCDGGADATKGDQKKGKHKKYGHHRKQYGYEHAEPELVSSGNIGLLTGNQLQLPVQVPVEVCGNAVAVLGIAAAECDGGAKARQ